MPRKIRELTADLRRAGFRELARRGKGSHRRYAHPGADANDARAYQERDVRDAIAAVREGEERRREQPRRQP